MYILGIDSSTEQLNIAVNNKESLLSVSRGESSKKHMVNIIGCIDAALGEAGIDISGVDIFAANIGPGDFTGTRIGLSVLKTFAWVSQKPAYGICAPDILALQTFFLNREGIARILGEKKEAVIIACMDVRRGEVYGSFYRIIKEDQVNNLAKVLDGDKNIIYRTHSTCIHKTDKSFLAGYQDAEKEIVSLLEGSDSSVYICGNAAESYRGIFGSLTKKRKGTFYDRRAQNPDAFYLNLAAYFKHQGGDAVENLVPFYVREFIPFGGKK